MVIPVQRKKMLLEHKKQFMKIPGQLLVIPVQRKKCSSSIKKNYVNSCSKKSRRAAPIPVNPNHKKC